MSFGKVYSAQTSLLKAHIVEIEVDISRGLHAFSIVGLPDKAVEESRDRISAAIKNSDYTSPKSKNQKIVISLAPADIKKEGPNFDLGMALCYLKASDEVHFDENKKLFIGELSLDGALRPIKGTLALVKHAKEKGYEEVFIPKENAKEAALIEGITVYGAKSLEAVIRHLENLETIEVQNKTGISYKKPKALIGFGDIKGQDNAKRGLEIAAAGGHNIVLYGPPGTGKTMLARAFTNILPPLSFKEILEVTSIHSIAGTLTSTLVTHPPFRSPHHTASYVSVVGGGTIPKPGEVTLAHRGVLFLDEFPEFERRVIDSLRQPIEDREVHISRVKGMARFPADFILVAAMNPCPCGNFGSHKECTCSILQRERYQKKISGPIIDRVDMWIEVPHVDIELLESKTEVDTETDQVKERILKARQIQFSRFSEGTLNSTMNVKDINNFVELTPEVKTILRNAANKLDLSPRAYHRVIKLSQTIADLENAKKITENHVLEALQYRPKQII